MNCGECATCIKADVVRRMRAGGVPLTAASQALHIIAREAAALGLAHEALKTADDVAALWRRIEARRRESRVAEGSPFASWFCGVAHIAEPCDDEQTLSPMGRANVGSSKGLTQEENR